jgi:hypothetical protein
VTLLFQRRARLTVARPTPTYSTEPNAIVIEGLQMAFSVEKDLDRTPNTAEITVVNASPATRAAMQDKGLRVILEAGYEDGLFRVFFGDARSVTHSHDGPDWITKIEAGDSERAWRWARVSESWKAGTKAKVIVARLAELSGLGLGNARQAIDAMAGAYAHGFAASGPAARELERVLRAQGYGMSVQDGEIQLLAAGAALSETVPDIAADSGLIGNVEHNDPKKKGEKPTVTVRALLQPQIRPGNRFRLRSSTTDGVYRAIKVSHTGDTEGADWQTEIEAEASS